MKLVFMGSPDFAVTCLDALVQSEHEVLAVVTVPDKPAGRGRQPRPSAVKQYALRANIPVLQPNNLREVEFIGELKRLNADIFIVVAFRILPAEVFDIPEQGTLNIHASLLPKYRGAAPINWAIINGEKTTGVSIIRIDPRVDTGNILMQQSTTISDEMNAGELHDILANQGALLLLNTLDHLDSIKPAKQDERSATKAPKLTKETAHLDFEKPAAAVYNLIRGLSPYPGAFALLNNKVLKVFQAEVLPYIKMPFGPGMVFDLQKDSFCVVCATDCIRVRELQLQGKQRMQVRDFLNGYALKEGQLLQ